MIKNYTLYKNVILGENAKIQLGAIIGLPPPKTENGQLPTVIGDNANIRSNTVIYAGTMIGDDLQTGHNVVIREDNTIGDNFNVWSNTVISPGNKIGNNVKVHCGCFIEHSVLEDNVFLGPHVVITDDLHPVCPKWKDCIGGAKIRKNTSIGGNVTILPGVEIGNDVLIGAGSVVTKNIPEKKVALGNPARITKNISMLKCCKGFFKKPYEWRKIEN